MWTRRGFVAGTAALAGGVAVAQADRDPAILRALAEGGVVALMRHATAPGTGDPPNFRLGECTTQRNLSEGGRRQAAALGRALRDAGVLVTEARSSRWCRALDTAQLAFPDIAVQPDPALDSFFEDRGSGSRQTEEVRALVLSWRERPGVLALVTHQVNITALTRVFPAEGEIVVLRPGADRFEVWGRVRL